MRLLRALLAALLLRSLGAVLAHAVIAATMALLWWNPMIFGPDVAGDMEIMLIVEFLVLHSTAFLVGFRMVKGFPRWVLLLIYAPFALVLGGLLSSWILIVPFFWHLAAGVWGDFDTAERHVMGFVIRYLPVVVFFIALPPLVVLFDLPAWGWAEYPTLWFETDQGQSYPALTPAWSTLYFAGRAVWEIAVRHWERTGAIDRFAENATAG